jgi:AAA+ ATPase superfamily predicted ATPase
MKFFNREPELERLTLLSSSSEGGLAVVYGRRRIGKTRLLLEWVQQHGGLYTVADLSTADVQRQYLSQAAAATLPGFADVRYPDWSALLARLAADARANEWRGPIVFDELPYLVQQSPELPSLLQRWIDHEARDARLAVAIAGSSQRMMQGLVLSPDAPLYGRAREIIELGPLPPSHLGEALELDRPASVVEAYGCWGGIPRYWELAAQQRGTMRARVERLALDPLGALHREPDRILLEEIPPALEVRPILDAIGSGAHRVSEIAGRIGRPATSMSRPLDRLVGMGLVVRGVPFGESEKKSRASLYRISDPFFRLWFRVVAPHRAQLASGPRESRLALLDRFWENLIAESWEDLCRARLPFISPRSTVGRLGRWGAASRWWKGNAPEWDLVSSTEDRSKLLLGEVKWSARSFSSSALRKEAERLAAREPPPLPTSPAREIVRALFVPEYRGETRSLPVRVVRAADLL